jgi:hypothetical protein
MSPPPPKSEFSRLLTSRAIRVFGGLAAEEIQRRVAEIKSRSVEMVPGPERYGDGDGA